MDFHSLQLFLAIAKSRSFIRTAEQHYMSPSTLSRHIQRLEEEVGQQLLFRDNRTVRLTFAGEQFLPFAERCCNEWAALHRQLNQKADKLEGELRLFCSVTAAYSHLPLILSEFRQRYPKVEIQLTTGDPALAVEKVKSGQVDISLAGENAALPEHFVFHPIDEIPFTLVAPRVACVATQLLQHDPIDWQNMPFILPAEGPARKLIDGWFKRQHIKNPTIYASVAGNEAIIPMVALGCGVALIPEVVLQHSLVGSQLSRLDLPHPILPLKLGICAEKYRLQEPVLRAFWQLLNHESNHECEQEN